MTISFFSFFAEFILPDEEIVFAVFLPSVMLTGGYEGQMAFSEQGHGEQLDLMPTGCVNSTITPIRGYVLYQENMLRF